MKKLYEVEVERVEKHTGWIDIRAESEEEAKEEAERKAGLAVFESVVWTKYEVIEVSPFAQLFRGR